MAVNPGDFDRYMALRDEFFASEGVRVHRLFLSNRITFLTFQTNYIELKNLIREHGSLHIAGKLGDAYDRAPLHAYLQEVTRRLHNFLASAKSLVDTTRNFIDAAYGNRPEVVGEYQNAVRDRFDNNALCKFILDLRIFFTHISPPFVASVMAGERLERFSLRINIGKMPNQDRWSKLARDYIDGRKMDIDLDECTADYYSQLIDFYEWLGDRREVWSKSAWDASIALQDQIIRIEKGGRPS